MGRLETHYTREVVFPDLQDPKVQEQLKETAIRKVREDRLRRTMLLNKATARRQRGRFRTGVRSGSAASSTER
jgi:hypothetical protein